MRRISASMLLAAVLAAAPILGAAQSSHAPASVTVPAGTAVNVRLTEGIDVDLAQAGMTFKARVDDPVSVDGRIVIPREAGAVVQAVRVAQSGELKGRDQISLKLNSISFGGRVHQIATEYATVQGRDEGRRTARKVGGGAGLGAIFGAVTGGGEGALIGATIGAVAGTAVATTGKQEQLKLPAETRLQFRLSSSVRIQP